MEIDATRLFEEIFPRLRTLERRQSYIAGIGVGVSLLLGALLVTLGAIGQAQVKRIDRVETQMGEFDAAWVQVQADLDAILKATQRIEGKP